MTEFCRANVGTTQYGTWQLGISYELLSQDVANNKSTYKRRVFLYCPVYINWSRATISIDSGSAINISLSLAAGTHTLKEDTIVVTHTTDGTCKITCSATISTSYVVNGSVSGSFSLPTIPRASSLTATDANIESATSINISRASAGFTHTLKYVFGTLSGTIATNVATSYGWTIPTSFYAQIPNAKSGTCKIVCETYSGSTLIGTKENTLKISVDESKNKPTVSAIIEDTKGLAIVLTGSKNKLIKFISNPEITITASSKNSATISSKKAVCGDGKTASNDVTFIGVESGKFTISATDSRGITSSIDYEKEIVDYIKLTLNPTFYRPSPTTGEVVLILNGNYFNGTFGQTENVLTLKCRYREAGTSNWSSNIYVPVILNGNTYSHGTIPIQIGVNFDYQKSYEFEITADDKITSITSPVQKVMSGKPIFDISKEDFQHNTVVYLKDGTEALGYEMGSNENGSWTKYSNGKMECYGKISMAFTISSATGSLYHGNYSNVAEFPQNFIEEPNVFFSNTNPNGAALIVGNYTASVSKITQIVLLSALTRNALVSTIPYYAVGKWK